MNWPLSVCASIDPSEIFDHYLYLSSHSTSWLEHARVYCELMMGRLKLGKSSLVVEVASNDGYLLRNFVAAGVPVLGVEPAQNIAELARERGIPTKSVFFGAANLAAGGRQDASSRGFGDQRVVDAVHHVGHRVGTGQDQLVQHFAGVAADEIEDPRATAEFLRQWSSAHPEFSFLPRKFKIAVTASPHDRAAIMVHDIGIAIIKNDNGETGYRVYVGGGNARLLDGVDLGPKATVVSNTAGILGGIAIWNRGRASACTTARSSSRPRRSTSRSST